MKFFIPLVAFTALVTTIMSTHPAQADDLKIMVTRPGDANLTCEQLWKEAFLMQSIIAQAESAERIHETAQQRREKIAGIFAAKKCEGPIQEAMVDKSLEERLQDISPAAGDEESPAIVSATATSLRHSNNVDYNR